MRIPWPQASQSWNEISLGGVVFPGIAHVRVTVANELEVKKAKGRSGASTTYQGRPPAKVKITLTVYAPEQWEALVELLPSIWPDVTSERGAPIEVVHPRCRLWKISRLIIESIDDSQPEGVGDVYVLQISAVEFLPSQTQKGAASGAATRTSSTLDVPQSLSPELRGRRPAKPSTSGGSSP